MKPFPTTHHDTPITMLRNVASDNPLMQAALIAQYNAQVMARHEQLQAQDAESLKAIAEAQAERRRKRAEYEALSPVARLFVDEPPKI